ncbi:MAG: agmatine deiminase family protein [Xanthomonadaceae bacterium]|nr:agmatine deiminase family protein [Xanthomonadaceae bacterium]
MQANAWHSISISTAGAALLINRHCLRARHPYLDDSEVDHELKSWLNIEHLIEIDMQPIAGDDTDGHIDTLVRFAGPRELVFQSLRDPADTRKLTTQLEALRDRQGRPFELFELPCPNDLEVGVGASYANFIMINDAVLVPRFGSRVDRCALDVLAERFPNRAIEAVNARALVNQGGGPHCASMQIPATLV